MAYDPYSEADGLAPDLRDVYDNLPAGVYPELVILKSIGWKDASNANKHYFRFDVEVAVAANGAEVGRRGSLFATIAGNTHDSYNRQEMGRVKLAVGCADGYWKPGPDGKPVADLEAITHKIGGERIRAVKDGDGLALAGCVIGAVITHKGDFQKYEAFPCIDPATGRVKRVGVSAAPAAQPAPQQHYTAPMQPAQPQPAAYAPPAQPFAVPAQVAPAPVQPPPVAAPAPVAAPYQPPPGWTLHPRDPAWEYELANPANMRPVPR